MPYSRQTLPEIINRVRADVISRLAQDDVLRRSDAEVYARVVAAVTHGLYGYIDWISRQVIYDTAEEETLDRWASMWLTVPRKPAAVATGSVTLTGLGGAVVPAGALLQALDGVQYATVAEVTFVGTSAVANVAAVLPAAAGNRAAGQTLTFATPVAGVQSGALASELVGGADRETDEALRARLLARIQTPPHGGSSPDYVSWALEVAGVTRAWCYPIELGAGTVTVRFMRDNDSGSAIPDAGEVAAVLAYINALKPVTAQVTVVAPVAVPLNLTISVTPNTSAVRQAVQDELADLIRREAVPGGTLLISRIRAAISAAAGEQNYTMSTPIADVVNTTGNITTLGTITWV
jgi:uncharacterized phage protein gp47/JayE